MFRSEAKTSVLTPQSHWGSKTSGHGPETAGSFSWRNSQIFVGETRKKSILFGLSRFDPWESPPATEILEFLKFQKLARLMELIWPFPRAYMGAKSSHRIMFSYFVQLLYGVLHINVGICVMSC